MITVVLQPDLPGLADYRLIHSSGDSRRAEVPGNFSAAEYPDQDHPLTSLLCSLRPSY